MLMPFYRRRATPCPAGRHQGKNAEGKHAAPEAWVRCSSSRREAGAASIGAVATSIYVLAYDSVMKNSALVYME